MAPSNDAIPSFSIGSVPVGGGYEAVGLGTLGGSWSEGYGINDLGQAVGLSDLPPYGFRGYLWEAGVMTDVGTLGGDNSETRAINNLGQMAGFASTAEGASHACLWDAGVPVDLGTLGGSWAYSFGINESAQVVGHSVTADRLRRGFLWDDGVMMNLGTLGGSTSEAWGINEQEQVVGYSSNADGRGRGFLWEDGVMIDLGTLGGDFSDAPAINDLGQVVGSSETATGQTHAYLWTEGVMTDLGTLGGSYSYAFGVNNQGQVVGTSGTADGHMHAFLWQDGVMIDLGGSTSESSWAWAINNVGQATGYIGSEAVVWMPSNAAPTLNADASEVTSAEGEIVLNGGSVADDDGDAVSLSASIGTVANNDDGSWSWSFPTSDGPAESQTVTIGADDGNGGIASVSFTLTVANVAPTPGSIAASLDPVLLGTPIIASADFTDPGTGDTHTATWDWGDENTTTGTVTQGAGSGSVTDDYTYSTPGVYEIVLTVTDNDGGSAYSEFQYVVVYDPEGGFVTGGGWINSPEGAYVDPSASGKASFGFVSKYKKGANVPTGNTQFQFKAGDLNFHSDVYDWLVVNQGGENAQFKGLGTINGAGEYKFMIWAGDSSTDTFRIKIWLDEDGEDESVIYDNGSQQAIGGGNIVIHN